MPSPQVALITGGASGLGLAVAQAYGAKGWTVHIVDFNKETGEAAAKAIPNAKFHATDVSSWESVSSAFAAAFKDAGRLDFVFANAGVVEKNNFYETPDSDEVPPQPNVHPMNVNLYGLVNQSYLALHYFRRSPHKGKGAALVITGSSSSLYPMQFGPVYAAAKAGVLNFVRSIAFPYHFQDGIRVNCILPGGVKTNILTTEEWKTMDEAHFTPISTIVSTVEALQKGGELKDAWDKVVPAGSDYGLAAEVSGENFYFRGIPDFCDEKMTNVMAATSMENHAARLAEEKAKSKGAV
ncbi:3-beta-hydroxysteroid dehydrogenase [Dactylonectria estremocensis]|uniref:3-beta-hydroxysteroid dehydrogenase n=1 Tax=Dactylonectria estremocensis TaxID=1079267 RepID=A0A9P9ENK1_9HYPO|nr:3-beta-hydroxysteroid dehydrogenase [Dactylonectria estremocensis]